MTLIVGGLATFLCAALTVFTGHVGSIAAARAHAQTAADAAALAAVAESGPLGRGLPEELARRYATLNGARLVSCLCEVGATGMQVTVAVGEVTARARAVLDPERILPAAWDTGSLHPVLQAAVDRLLAAAQGSVTVVSGHRSAAQQQGLWRAAVARYGDPEIADDWVARPGTSMHERGLAVDLGGDLAAAVELINRLDLPLVRPLVHEPWHFELASG